MHRGSLDTFNESGFRLINEGKMGDMALFFSSPLSLNMSDGSLKAPAGGGSWKLGTKARMGYCYESVHFVLYIPCCLYSAGMVL